MPLNKDPSNNNIKDIEYSILESNNYNNSITRGSPYITITKINSIKASPINSTNSYI